MCSHFCYKRKFSTCSNTLPLTAADAPVQLLADNSVSTHIQSKHLQYCLQPQKTLQSRTWFATVWYGTVTTPLCMPMQHCSTLETHGLQLFNSKDCSADNGLRHAPLCSSLPEPARCTQDRAAPSSDKKANVHAQMAQRCQRLSEDAPQQQYG